MPVGAGRMVPSYYCRIWNILFRIFYRKGAIQIINFIIIMYGAELL